MKMIHRLLNSGLFRFLSACGFGWIVHDPVSVRTARRQDYEADKPTWSGHALYAAGMACGLAGIVLNVSDSVKLGTLLIGIGITVAVSNAIRLGHLKVW